MKRREGGEEGEERLPCLFRKEILGVLLTYIFFFSELLCLPKQVGW